MLTSLYRVGSEEKERNDPVSEPSDGAEENRVGSEEKERNDN